MRLALILVCFLMFGQLHAQEADRNTYKLGIKTSINISSLLGTEFENPRPKFGYSAGVYFQTPKLKKNWSLHTEALGSFRGSNFSNGDTGYSRIALFYVDVAALPQYTFQEGKKSISFGPYLSYLGLSSLYIGEKKKAELNNLDIDPLDAGFVTYFTIHGPLASFQVGGKLGLKDVNNGINFDTYYPRTGKNGIIRNLSLEIGVLF